MKIKDYTKVGGTANAREEKKIIQRQAVRKRSKKIRFKVEKCKVYLWENTPNQDLVEGKNNNARAEVEQNIRHTLATGKETTTTKAKWAVTLSQALAHSCGISKPFPYELAAKRHLEKGDDLWSVCAEFCITKSEVADFCWLLGSAASWQKDFQLPMQALPQIPLQAQM